MHDGDYSTGPQGRLKSNKYPISFMCINRIKLFPGKKLPTILPNHVETIEQMNVESKEEKLT